MATLREFLDESGFDWEAGRIIYQPVKGDSCPPGWGDLDKEAGARVLSRNSAILDQPFDDGIGSPQCPCYVAEDARAIYFPSQYDGATNPEWVLKDLDVYLRCEVATPYPGG